jgi:hypothetical protein
MHSEINILFWIFFRCFIAATAANVTHSETHITAVKVYQRVKVRNSVTLEIHMFGLFALDCTF